MQNTKVYISKFPQKTPKKIYSNCSLINFSLKFMKHIFVNYNILYALVFYCQAINYKFIYSVMDLPNGTLGMERQLSGISWSDFGHGW